MLGEPLLYRSASFNILVVDKLKNHLLVGTRGELSARVDVDKWALSSCLMWLFGVFASANLALPTLNLAAKTVVVRLVFTRTMRKMSRKLWVGLQVSLE
jgi:hypothetical protein